jgi:hypothetical protein
VHPCSSVKEKKAKFNSFILSLRIIAKGEFLYYLVGCGGVNADLKDGR